MCAATLQGSVKVWRIEDMEQVEWPEPQNGHFFSGDSYLVLYSYKANDGSPAAVVYMWQAREPWRTGQLAGERGSII